MKKLRKIKQYLGNFLINFGQNPSAHFGKIPKKSDTSTSPFSHFLANSATGHSIFFKIRQNVTTIVFFNLITCNHKFSSKFHSYDFFFFIKRTQFFFPICRKHESIDTNRVSWVHKIRLEKMRISGWIA